MRQSGTIVPGIRLLPWAIVGVMLLGTDTPSTAQEATPAPTELGMETTVTPAELPEATKDEVGSGNPPSTMPSAGVGPGFAAGGTAPLSLGALVGAGVAAVFALRERFKNR